MGCYHSTEARVEARGRAPREGMRKNDACFQKRGGYQMQYEVAKNLMEKKALIIGTTNSPLPVILRPDLGIKENGKPLTSIEADQLVHTLNVAVGNTTQTVEVERQSTDIGITRLTESEKRRLLELGKQVLAEGEVGHKIIDTFLCAICACSVNCLSRNYTDDERFRDANFWAAQFCKQNLTVRTAYLVTRVIRSPPNSGQRKELVKGQSSTFAMKVVALDEFGEPQICSFESMAKRQEKMFAKEYNRRFGNCIASST